MDEIIDKSIQFSHSLPKFVLYISRRRMFSLQNGQRDRAMAPIAGLQWVLLKTK